MQEPSRALAAHLAAFDEDADDAALRPTVVTRFWEATRERWSRWVVALVDGWVVAWRALVSAWVSAGGCRRMEPVSAREALATRCGELSLPGPPAVDRRRPTERRCRGTRLEGLEAATRLLVAGAGFRDTILEASRLRAAAAALDLGLASRSGPANLDKLPLRRACASAFSKRGYEAAPRRRAAIEAALTSAMGALERLDKGLDKGGGSAVDAWDCRGADAAKRWFLSGPFPQGSCTHLHSERSHTSTT